MPEDDVDVRLLGVIERASASRGADAFLAEALPLLRTASGALTVVVLAPAVDGPVLSHHDGRQVPPDVVAVAEGLARHLQPAPSSWRDRGIGSVLAQNLPGHLGTLVLGWEDDTPDPMQADLLISLSTILAVCQRIEAESALRDLQHRVDGAQQLAGMGDYDWHIASDTNRWSDQLYRIYGHQPQSFNPSYERFLAQIHPDDRERIQAVHQRAYASGEPYAMIERIVRPSGEIRHLSSNGEVVRDADGVPVRMRGTCIDITARVLAEQERERVAARFHGLVDRSPDAILVADAERRIVQANPRAVELLGADPVGHATSWLAVHHLTTGLAQQATGLDGAELVLDVIEVDLDGTDHDARTALFLDDATPRLEREAMAQRLAESRQRRRQAFEINDNVVQGLTAASDALERSSLAEVRDYLDRTLEAARAMMEDLLDPAGETLAAGDLVRSEPAMLTAAPQPEPFGSGREIADPPAPADSGDLPRVLIADDSPDLRMLLRLQLAHAGSVEIVGEAVDGVDAVALTRTLQPDLVLLDMAMPRMDGLEALPLIRAAAPEARVIVFSGLGQTVVQEQALAAGAARYVVKGGPIRDLLAAIASVLEAA